MAEKFDTIENFNMAEKTQYGGDIQYGEKRNVAEKLVWRKTQYGGEIQFGSLELFILNLSIGNRKTQYG